MVSEYEKKFTEFVKLCNTTEKGTKIVIAEPRVLGNTYEELIESLNRLADAELDLEIVPRKPRG